MSCHVSVILCHWTAKCRRTVVFSRLVLDSSNCDNRRNENRNKNDNRPFCRNEGADGTVAEILVAETRCDGYIGHRGHLRASHFPVVMVSAKLLDEVTPNTNRG